jgi:trimeric autotransporter adhesin
VKNRTSLPSVRLFVWLFLGFIFCTLCVGPLMAAAPGANPGAGLQSGPKIWLAEPQAVAVNHLGSASVVAPLLAGQAQPLAMISADVDGDGIADLLVGYSTPNGGAIAVYRGNLDAFAPQSDASFQAIGRGQFPSPFLPDAKAFAIPVRPDFVATGDFTGQGRVDIVVASRGGSTLYIFNGDGKGSFAPGPTISVPGGITSLGTGFLGKSLPFTDLIVGVSSSKQSFLAVYAGSSEGLAPLSAFPLKAPATSINFGEFGDMGPDAAFLSGGQVVLLHSSTMQLETLSLPVNAQAMVLGSFVYDRVPGLQIAVLDSNGTIAIVAHNEFDPRVSTVDEMRSIRKARRNGLPNALIVQPFVATHGWKVIESVPSAATFSSSQPPVLLRTRISNQGADDVMAISPFTGQMTVFSHPDPVPGTSTFVPGALSTRPYSGSPVAAISARVNVDGRPGVLALHQGEMAPRVMMPLPDPTFTVNRTDDPAPVSPITNACNGVANDCSLREAILRANATAGTDTVMVPNGTYTLTIAKVADDCTGNFGALSVEDSITIVGGGQATTIIQAGATQAAGVDMVMNVNEDLGTGSCPETNASASLSNLTLQNGHNRGTHGNDGDGGCMEYDTGTSGNATLNLTNVTLNNCTTTQGNGGGIAIFNFETPGGTGSATISNSTISGNSANDSVSVGTAGGIWVSQSSRLTMTNSQVINNLATQVNGPDPGTGGGMTTTSNVSGSPTVTIHASTISGNQAAGQGGGIKIGTNILIDQGTLISGNSAGSANLTNEKDGGGIFADLVTGDSATLTKVTISGNHAPNGTGGGIFNGSNSGGGSMTISFSRLAGNTASTAASNNLNNDDTTITATNDWWGTNTPASTINNANGGVTTFDPFIVLTHTPNSPTINLGASTTLTASFLQDNHGTPISVSNLDVLLGLPISFDNALDGSLSNPEAVIQPVNTPVNILATTESSSTVTVTTSTAHGFATGEGVVIAGVGLAGYNGTFTITGTPSTTTFTYTDAATGLADSSGGTATIGPAGTATVTFTGTIGGNPGVIGHADATVDNGTATANVTIVAVPPAATKSFGAATIPLNGTTSLTFTIPNGNADAALTGVAFTDSLPTALVVATPGNLSSTCGGATIAADGSTSVVLSGGTIAIGASCTISVNVTGTAGGVKINSVQATSTNAGTGAVGTASMTVVAPPGIAKQFGALTIPLNGTTSLSFTLTNPNSTGLTGVSFSDPLPAGLIISTPNGLSALTGCGGATVTATQGTNVISLSGASIVASGSCTFSVNVTGRAAGQQNNTTGNVTSTEGGTGGTASALLVVVAPPSIAKAFGAAAIPLNGTTSLTFTITNPAANAAAENGVAFTDTLPTGLVVSTPNGLTNSCGGTATAVAGSTSISLTGGTTAVNASCTVVVNVTGTASGQYTNVSGAVTSTNGGTGNTATAILTVASAPSITKQFGTVTIPLNGTTTLTFNITNPNTNVTLTGVAFTDLFPSGIVVGPTPNGTNTCGGTFTSVTGAGSVSLTGGTLAPSASCTASVTVQGTTPGVKNNSVQVTSTGGTGNTSNASITVVAPPVITKQFGALTIPLSGTTSLSFTLTNPNATTALTGVAFSDTLPTGMIVSTPNGLTGACGSGTITATAGSGGISLTGTSLAAGGSCTFSVNVTGRAAGQQNNTTGNVTSTEGGTGGTASALLVVVAPPSIAKAFNPVTIAPNGVTTLTFTITNPAANPVAEAGVAFTDTLPAGLVVSTPSGLINNCGGTATATAGSGSISLTGGSIVVSSNCTVAVSVTGATPGTYNNTSGAVSSANGGTGNTASATLSIKNAVLSITKTHQGTFHRGQNGAQYFLTVSDSANAGPTVGAVTVVDTLPAIGNPHNLQPVSLTGTGWTCDLPSLTCTRSDPLAPGASYPVITFTVNIPQNITNNFTNTATVSGGGDPNNHTASDPVSLGPPIQITSTDSGTATVPAGMAATFNFMVDASGVNPPAAVVAFTCSGQPAGTACIFNPLAEGQITQTMTMTVTTLGHATATAPPMGKYGPPIFAALLLPMIGLVGVSFRARKSKKTRLRLALAFGGLMLLMALLGCGGSPQGIPTMTQRGTFTITVTGTAATPQGTAQGSATVTLTVQ